MSPIEKRGRFPLKYSHLPTVDLFSRAYAYSAADNLIYNSGLRCGGSATAPNIEYPAQGVSKGRPHAPKSICGSPVTYHDNGNTLSYDNDGAGPKSARSLIL
jgi:hypothetical protein